MLKNLNKKEKSFNSSIIALSLKRKSLSMTKVRRMVFRKKTSIFNHTNSFLNTWISMMKITKMILDISNWLMVLKGKDSMRQLSMIERCSYNNSKRNINNRKDSLKLWVKSKKRVNKILMEAPMKSSRFVSSLRMISICWKRKPMKRKEFWPRLHQWS